MSLELFMPDALALADLNGVGSASSDFLSQVTAAKRQQQSQSTVSAVPQQSEAELTPMHAVRTEADDVFKKCATTVSSADAALELLDQLDKKHKDIAARTSLLHAECKKLVDDESRMRTMSQRIYTPLTYFESCIIIGRRLGVKFSEEDTEQCVAVMHEMQKLGVAPPGTKLAVEGPMPVGVTTGWNPHRVRVLDLPLLPEDEDFPAALDRLDECISWLANHVSYRDARDVLGRMKEVQGKAIEAVLHKLKTAVDRVAASAAADIRAAHAAVATVSAAPEPDPRALAQAISTADAVEISALQLRWRTELATLRPLLALIDTRAPSKRVYMDAAKAAYGIYASARLAAVSPAASGRLERVVADTTRAMRQTRPAASSAAAVRGAMGRTAGSVSIGDTGSVAGGDAASVYSSYTGRTALTAGTRGTRGTLLYGQELTNRESCVVDAVRSCAALLARIVSGEHALFHSLFTSAGGARGGPGSASESGRSVYGAGSGVGYGDDREDGASTGGQSRRGGAGSIRLPSSSASVAGTDRTSLTRGTMATGLTVGGLPASVRSAADAALAGMCEELCGVLQEALNPALRAVASLDSLVDVVTVLREEVIREVAAPRGPVLAPLAKAAEALLADVREKLAFRASGFIAEHLEGHKAKRDAVTHPLLLSLPLSHPDGAIAGGAPPLPSYAVTGITVRGELDYPARLVAYYLRLRSATEAEAATRAAMSGAKSSAPGAAVPIPDPSLTLPPSLYDSWLPVVEDALLLMAKLHASLDRPAFEALAREAVHACAQSVMDAGASVRAAASKHASAGDRVDGYLASRLVAAAADGALSGEGADMGAAQAAPAGPLVKGLPSAAIRVQDPALAAQSAANTAALDGHLLVVKSLLTLREQLSPYDMDPILTQSSLDFTPTGQALAGIVAGIADRSLFTFSTGNPLVGLFTKGMPSVSEERIDVRARLETSLRGTADQAIKLCTASLTAQLSTLLQPKSSSSGSTDAAAVLSSSLVDAIRRTRVAFQALLPAFRRRFGLYLGSPTTASILWRPVREQTAHAIIAARANVQELLEGSASSEVRGALDGALGVLLGDLDAVNSLVIDPSDPAFGMDEVQWKEIQL